MKTKPSKYGRVSIVKGKKADKRSAVSDEVVPTALEYPVKSLGRWYDAR